MHHKILTLHMWFPAGCWQRPAYGIVRGIRPPTPMQPGSLQFRGHFCLSTTTITQNPCVFQCLSHHLCCRWPPADSEVTAKPLLRDTTPNTPHRQTVLHSHHIPPLQKRHRFISHSVLKLDIKHILNCCNHSCLKCLYFFQWNLLE